MRIVAGEFRGRPIEAPEGKGTRPTIDRVRESLFSSLYSKLDGFTGVTVLDAFAGSGALGIEALSRGATSAVFYERDEKAARIIQRNLSSLGLKTPRAILRKVDVVQSPPANVTRGFSLVLLDPPYAMEPLEVLDFIEKLRENGALAEDAIVCYEHDTSTKMDAFLERCEEHWEELSTRKYGKVSITMLQLMEE